MRGKILVGMISAFMIALGMSENVLAHTGSNNDLLGAEETDFQNLITKVLEIKKEHPDWTEEEIINSINKKMDTELRNARSLGDIWNKLTHTEKKLVIRYPFSALKVNKAKNIATAQTEIKFGRNGLGDRSDAFRHGMWNAEMTILIGIKKAEMFATAHEDKDTTGLEVDGFPKIEHKKMDLHNNEIGRDIGALNLKIKEGELADIIFANIYQEKSRFIWLHE